MMDVLRFLSQARPEIIAGVVLLQASVAMAAALVIALTQRHHPARKQMILRAGMIGAIACPLLTLAFKSYETAPFTIALPVGGIHQAASRPTEADVSAPDPQPAPDGIFSLPKAELTAPRATAKRSATPRFAGSPATTTVPTATAAMHPAWILLAVWSLGLACFGWGLARSWWKLRRIIRSARPLEHTGLAAVTDELRELLSWKSTPRVLGSDAVSGPAAAGFVRPVILLPVGLCDQLDSRELRIVLLHEMAHIKRRDQWNLLFDELFRAMLWLHPLSHLLVRWSAKAREQICDNYVLRIVDGPSYGQSLLRVTRLLPTLSSLPAAVGLFHPRWRLEERISGLLHERRARMVKTTLVAKALTAAFMALVVLPIGLTRLTAHPPVDPEGRRSEVGRRNDAPTEKAFNVGEVTTDVIAVVNGEPITIDELAIELLYRYGRDQVDSLVNRKLLEQACRKHGITITDAELESSASRTAAKFGLTPERWYELLKSERGLDADAYHRDVVWPTVALTKLAGDGDVDGYFGELKSRAEILKRTEELKNLQTHSLTGRRGSKLVPTRIAFINVGRVFNESERFQRRTGQLKTDVEQTQRELKQLAEECKSLKRAMTALPNHSDNDPVRGELERLLLRKQAQIQQTQQESSRRLRQAESESYLATYRQIYAEVKRYAREHRIELVLRDPGDHKSRSVFESTDPDTIDPKNSQAVIQRINQHVLYVAEAEKEERVDITDAIIQRLKNQN